MKININHPQTTDVNISKAQPSKATGLGGVVFLRSKSAPTLYKYSQQRPLRGLLARSGSPWSKAVKDKAWLSILASDLTIFYRHSFFPLKVVLLLKATNTC